jgi:hypothetical protein
MRSLLVLVLLSSLARADSDPRAVAAGKQLWNALGGDDGWSRARYLAFDWVVDKDGKRVVTRSHKWDRFTGRYRLDGTDEKEGAYSVYLDVNRRDGVALVGGKPVSDAAKKKKWLDDAYEAFINDGYWLLAPYKLFDPGVTLAWAGEDKGPDGKPADVIKLSFDKVGLTPNDVYWMVIDRASHLVVEWRYVLDGKKDPPTRFTWAGWRKVGSIQLAQDRVGIGRPVAIRTLNLVVSEKPDDAALTPPP